uniref:Kazal-like domain-containing protein n=1 Tax=Globisporangium ultimum (strain ATCC 200006 / CBS 805.95 / DAOM BR144) TaxID=431595 RepID=K3X4K7_GLOUD
MAPVLHSLLASAVFVVALMWTPPAAAAAVRGSCARDCGSNRAPICASDGVTYANSCLFDQAHCVNNELLPMHYGDCIISAS